MINRFPVILSLIIYLDYESFVEDNSSVLQSFFLCLGFHLNQF